MEINAKVDVNNIPEEFESMYIVARRDENTAYLWYYGEYDSEEIAYRVAREIRNGVVIELAEEQK